MKRAHSDWTFSAPKKVKDDKYDGLKNGIECRLEEFMRELMERGDRSGSTSPHRSPEPSSDRELSKRKPRLSIYNFESWPSVIPIELSPFIDDRAEDHKPRSCSGTSLDSLPEEKTRFFPEENSNNENEDKFSNEMIEIESGAFFEALFDDPDQNVMVDHRMHTNTLASLLMTAKSIQLVTNVIYFMESVRYGLSQTHAESIRELRGRVFVDDQYLDLGTLAKAVALDNDSCDDSFSQEDKLNVQFACDYFNDLIRLLVEIFIYCERGLDNYFIFDLKLSEIYEANRANLVEILKLIFKLTHAVQIHIEPVVESPNELDVEELYLVRELNRENSSPMQKKTEIGSYLTSNDLDLDSELASLDELLAEAESLSDLGAETKTLVLRKLNEILLTFGHTNRSYMNKIETDLEKLDSRMEELKAGTGDAEKIFEKDFEPLEELQAKYDRMQSHLRHVFSNEPIASFFSPKSSNKVWSVWKYDDFLPNCFIFQERQHQDASFGERWVIIEDDCNDDDDGHRTEFHTQNRERFIIKIWKLIQDRRVVSKTIPSYKKLSRFRETKKERKPLIKTELLVEGIPNKSGQSKNSTHTRRGNKSHEDRQAPHDLFNAIHSSVVDFRSRIVQANFMDYILVFESVEREKRFKELLMCSTLDQWSMPIKLTKQKSLDLMTCCKKHAGSYFMSREVKAKATEDLCDFLCILYANIKKQFLSPRFVQNICLGRVWLDCMRNRTRTLSSFQIFLFFLEKNIKWEMSMSDMSCCVCLQAGSIGQASSFTVDHIKLYAKLICRSCQICVHNKCLVDSRTGDAGPRSKRRPGKRGDAGDSKIVKNFYEMNGESFCDACKERHSEQERKLLENILQKQEAQAKLNAVKISQYPLRIVNTKRASFSAAPQERTPKLQHIKSE